MGLYKKGPVTIVSKKPVDIYYVKLIIKIGYVGFTQVSPEQAKKELLKYFELK